LCVDCDELSVICFVISGMCCLLCVKCNTLSVVRLLLYIVCCVIGARFVCCLLCDECYLYFVFGAAFLHYLRLRVELILS